MNLTCTDSDHAAGQCLHLNKFAIRSTAERAVLVAAPALRATVDNRTRVIHTCRDRRHAGFKAEHRHCGGRNITEWECRVSKSLIVITTPALHPTRSREGTRVHSTNNDLRHRFGQPNH